MNDPAPPLAPPCGVPPPVRAVRVRAPEAEQRGEVLLPEEAACLPARAMPARRRDFWLGRVAGRRALQALGHPATPLLIGAGRAPVWPPGVVGSISHAGGEAVAAAAWSREVAALGLDLEVIRPLDAGVAGLIADPAEQAWIGGDPARLIRLFSAKESIFKALYPLHGAFFDFDAVHLDPAQTDPRGDPSGLRPAFIATLQKPLDPYRAGVALEVLAAALTVGGEAAVLTMVVLERRERAPGAAARGAARQV